MKSFDEALAYLVNIATPTQKIESVPIYEALGRVLATDIVSTVNVPPHDNSMMDGYGLSSQFETEDAVFDISQRIAAGDVGQPLADNTVVRIFTGAAIPAGVDMVIMQEECEMVAEKVKITAKITWPGINIRRCGEDIEVGSIILAKGHVLRAQDLGLVSSIGLAHVTVYNILTIATFTTGDELLEPGQPAEDGKIFNANRYVLAGAVPQLGFKLIDLGPVEDTLESTMAAMTHAAELADVVITTGGVSVGEEDHIKPAIEKLGSLAMWKVKMKPGKPIAFGNIKGTPFIGLPGNPVSAFATFHLFAKPFLLTMQGAANVDAKTQWMTAGFEWTKPGFRREFARAKLVTKNAQTQVKIYKNQGSGVLMSTVWADGFVVIPEDTTIEKGDKVAFIPFN